MPSRRGLARFLRHNSLSLFFLVIFLAALAGQAIAGHNLFNEEQAAHGDFWEATFQNWQSEFLAVGSFAVIAIYLRQRGSPVSKPVGAPTDDATGEAG
jgi:hypothetical protein